MSYLWRRRINKGDLSHVRKFKILVKWRQDHKDAVFLLDAEDQGVLY